MKHTPIKLGPLALLLAVICICLTTLSLLNYSTAKADERLAEKFAETVALRYELEREGQELLSAVAAHGPDEGWEKAEDGTLWRVLEKDGAMLRIGLSGDATGPILPISGRETKRGEEIMTIQEILQKAIALDAADIFLIAGLPVTFKCGGRQERMPERFLRPDDITALVDSIYELSRRGRGNLERGVDDDFSFAVPQLGRFRVNVFRQRGSLAAVIRVIRFGLPDPAKLGIPESVLSLADNKKGLVLITGSAGTGKSTTLACMIDRINRSRDCHIITMEDPIEYIHRHDKAIVTQREISIDTPGYLESLRSALRESPDVILLGEMRDYDTISAALTAAETGVLLLSTLHTSSAANTINRILDVFPANQQKQVKIQLAQILKGVVCQQLVPSVDGGQLPVFEIMKSTVAISNMIREDKLHQLESAMQAGSADGMCTMDGSLLKLWREGKITKDTALLSCVNYENMVKRLGV